MIEFSLTLDSNPEFTGSVLVACARAAHRMTEEGMTGCKTIFDIPPAYLSARSGEELRATHALVFPKSSRRGSMRREGS